MAIMGKGKSWWPWLVVLATVAAMLVVTGLTIAPVFDEADPDKWGKAAGHAPLAGFVLAAAVALISTVRWGWQRSRWAGVPAVPTADALVQAKAALAELVKQQWKEEALLRLLDDPDPIPVRWRTPEAADLMDHPVNIDPAGAAAGGAAGLWWVASSADIGALAEKFRRTRRRRLVILGGPGTGKTTLAVQLLLHLLATGTDGEPVPVLLPVAGWDTRRYPRLQEWIADRLTGDYPALCAPESRAQVVRALAGRGHVLPVLDGLDELPPAAQTTVITALNRSLGGDQQLILTSRTTDFATATTMAGDVITSAAVLEPRPLTPAAAADYLTRCLPPSAGRDWQQTLTALRATLPADQIPPGRAVHRPAGALADLTATPLGLWLVRTVCAAPGDDFVPLTDPACFPTPAALQAHLFDQLIPAVITTRPPSDNSADPFRPRRSHDPAQVRHWLGYLARHLTTQPVPGGRGTRDFAWWRLASTTRTLTRSTRLALALLTAVVTGLASGLAIGLTTEDVGGLMYTLTLMLMAGLTTGLMAGLAVGLRAQSWVQDSPGYADLHIRRRSAALVRSLAARLPLALGVGFGAGFGSGFGAGAASLLMDERTTPILPDEPEIKPIVFLLMLLMVGSLFGFIGGLLFGPPLALALGVMAWAATPAQPHHATTPISNWRTDRKLNLLRFSSITLAVALTFTAAIELVLRSADWSVPGFVDGHARLAGLGLALGFAFGLTGLAFGQHRAWWAYQLTTWKLARAGHMPRRLMPFLDDCHRLGLLRAVGPIYQFRHAELHDHLAAAHPSLSQHRQEPPPST